MCPFPALGHSFGNALHADLAEDFGVALFSRAMPYDLSLTDDVQPDTLIVELVERNLCWLCTRPPLLPAPVREQTFDGATDFGTLDVTRSSAREHYHALYKWADETIALHHVFTSNQRLDRR